MKKSDGRIKKFGNTSRNTIDPKRIAWAIFTLGNVKPGGSSHG